MFSNKIQSKVEIQENFVTNLRLNGQFYSTGANDFPITKSRRRDGFFWVGLFGCSVKYDKKITSKSNDITLLKKGSSDTVRRDLQCLRKTPKHLRDNGPYSSTAEEAAARGAAFTDTTTGVILQKVWEVPLISTSLQVQGKEQPSPPARINHWLPQRKAAAALSAV